MKIHHTFSKINIPVQEIRNLIKKKASELGFYSCGIIAATSLDHYKPQFDRWITNGYQASMKYMERNYSLRFNPSEILPGGKSIICLTHNYYNETNCKVSGLKIARYAYGKDYHVILKNKMNLLLGYVKELEGSVKGRVFTDSAPLLERAIAVEAGLGWIGKNSMLIIPGAGSYFFLSEIIVDINLGQDEAFNKNHCGTCTKCIQACPTKAIVEPGVIDARKCISYVTIEQDESDINQEVIDKSPYLFGCDICQDVCPWNRFSRPHSEPEFNPLKFNSLYIEDVNYQIDFNKTYAESPLLRAGFDKLNKIYRIKCK